MIVIRPEGAPEPFYYSEQQFLDCIGDHPGVAVVNANLPNSTNPKASISWISAAHQTLHPTSRSKPVVPAVPRHQRPGIVLSRRGYPPGLAFQIVRDALDG